VKAKFAGKKWFKGKITRVREDGTYDVLYEDGDRERGVKSEWVRVAADEETAKPKDDAEKKPEEAATRFKAGTQVKAKFAGKKWFKGKITRVREDGTYDVLYEDGDNERKVKSEWVRALEEESAKPKDGAEKKPKEGVVRLKAGTQVKAKFGGKKWFKGKITRANDDGTYDVLYEDGDRERGVKSDWVRVAAEEESAKSKDDAEENTEEAAARFKAGTQVKAKFAGKKWFKGKITRVRDDGTYDVLYEDGDNERKVKPEWVRAIEEESAKPKKDTEKNSDEASAGLTAGTRVKAKYGGKKWFKGKITRVNDDGTYDVLYEDGDRERGVKEKWVRPLED